MKQLNRAFRAFSKFVLMIVAPFVRLLEKLFLNCRRENFEEPIFIIGAPRTGSTILYQALTNVYDIAYIDNTACKWYRNLRFGMWLSQKISGNNPHNNFEADLGETQHYGCHAPSECGSFWYRWLPRERHFIDEYEITPTMIKEIKEEIDGVSSYLGKPMLFKNLNAGQRLSLIKKVFPNARVIFVRRDPRFVIRSILRARRSLGVKAHEWWSIMPSNVTELLCLSEPEMCASQVYFLEQQIEKDLKMFPAESVKEVHYQAFSEELIHDLGKWLGVPLRNETEIPTFWGDDLSKLSEFEQDSLESLTSKYPFKKELFI
ncbi:MAG: sulfotransferase family protein [Neptuniibacter sp.]